MRRSKKSDTRRRLVQKVRAQVLSVHVVIAMIDMANLKAADNWREWCQLVHGEHWQREWIRRRLSA
jgi:hypothetical protein